MIVQCDNGIDADLPVPRVVPRLGGAAAEQGRPAGHPGAPARTVSGKGSDQRRHRLVALRLVERDLAGKRRRERLESVKVFPDFEFALLRSRQTRERGGCA